MPRRLALAAVLLVTAAMPARAEHEVYYRYTVLGYVKDAQGRPVADAHIEVTRDRTGFSYLGDTDASGLYVVVTRLGDESRGESLTVRSGTRARRITAAFDPANHTDERGTRVDFEGASIVERAVWFRSTLLNVVGATRR